MTDEAHAACYDNATMEWEQMKLIDDNPSVSDHVNWCAEHNFGVNNFGINPKLLPLSCIRHDVGLHMVCAIIRKVLHCLRQHLDRHSSNDGVYNFFDAIWTNTFFSNQFRCGEACSRINGEHVATFVHKVDKLVEVMKNEYEQTTYLKHMNEVLLLLPSLMKFWKKVKIESESSYLDEISTYETNIDLFYEHGAFCLFTNSILGDGETFYAHVAKFYVPRMARWTLTNLKCGVGIWTMQGFEHRNKESKYVYANKTNGKGNCCMQVLKGVHQSFLQK